MIEKSKALDKALEKTAGIMDRIKTNYGGVKNAVNAGFASGDPNTVLSASKLVGGYATSAILAGYGVQKLIKSLMNDHARKSMVEDLMLNDPLISQADPDRVKEFYATIHYMAPSVSGDKNVVRELLQNFIKFDRVDLNSVKALVDTHKSITQGRRGLAERVGLLPRKTQR